jgi:hypothetical protein
LCRGERHATNQPATNFALRRAMKATTKKPQSISIHSEGSGAAATVNRASTLASAPTNPDDTVPEKVPPPEMGWLSVVVGAVELGCVPESKVWGVVELGGGANVPGSGLWA